MICQEKPLGWINYILFTSPKIKSTGNKAQKRINIGKTLLIII